MFKPVNRNNIVIFSFFLISAGFAGDELNDLINDEYENMSNRTSIDYHTKVVQVWHDSSWTNKAKTMKNYDENGYLFFLSFLCFLHKFPPKNKKNVSM